MCREQLKAFGAGIGFPGTFFAVLVGALWILGRIDILEKVPLFFVPLLYGVTNVLYFAIGKNCPIKDSSTRLFATGAGLGFIFALDFIFVHNAPTVVLGWTGNLVYLPLIAAPIVHGLIYRYIVKYLNDLAGLKEW